jgi:dUTP pyrophosphatase
MIRKRNKMAFKFRHSFIARCPECEFEKEFYYEIPMQITQIVQMIQYCPTCKKDELFNIIEYLEDIRIIDGEKKVERINIQKSNDKCMEINEIVDHLTESAVEIRFKKLDQEAKLPSQNHIDDTGFDVFCSEECFVAPKTAKVVPTGIQVAYITPGYWFRVEARSGLSFKHNLLPHPGIVDSGYRGGLGILMYNHGEEVYNFKPGDKIAQIVIYKLIKSKISWSEEIHETERGGKGFGSSGR